MSKPKFEVGIVIGESDVPNDERREAVLDLLCSITTSLSEGAGLSPTITTIDAEVDTVVSLLEDGDSS